MASLWNPDLWGTDIWQTGLWAIANAPFNMNCPNQGYAVGQGGGTAALNMQQYFGGGVPTSWVCNNLPAGGAWAFNTSTGVLTVDTSTATVKGNISVNATNADGTGHGNVFTITVSAVSKLAYAGFAWQRALNAYR